MITIKTRWFRLLIGQANWLPRMPRSPKTPFSVRLMWKPVDVARVRLGDPLPCAWDVWINWYGFVVNQRNYRVVKE